LANAPDAGGQLDFLATSLVTDRRLCEVQKPLSIPINPGKMTSQSETANHCLRCLPSCPSMPLTEFIETGLLEKHE